ncbi:MAG: ureidoglycolate lyase, partial [Pseudomonadota bacterium]
VPGVPHAFLATGAQGVTYATNVWHHPLIAVKDVSDFLVIDRDGKGGNLEEAFYPAPHILQSSEIG